MEFADFARAHGLVVDSVISGRWVRVPTTDHPRKRNGAYKWLGDVGWVQNHATMTTPETWRAREGSVRPVDVARIRAAADRIEAATKAGWARAAARATELLEQATPTKHGYLIRKGFGEIPGLVLPEGNLIVPMRNWRTNNMAGAQIISWDGQRWNKKMLPGMRAKGAVLRLGPLQARRTWLVEGWATALSVEAATRLLARPEAILVCFSAGNMKFVAGQLRQRGQAIAVFADNDASGVGQQTAREIGAPWVMSDVVGEDANDLHKRAGLFAVSRLMMTIR